MYVSSHSTSPISLGAVSVWCHCEPDAVHQEQCRLVTNLALPLDLQSGYAFLEKWITCQNAIAPVAQFGILDSSYTVPMRTVYCCFAIAATPEIISLCCVRLFSRQSFCRHSTAATMNASRIIAPTLVFEKFNSGQLVYCKPLEFPSPYKSLKVDACALPSS